MFSESVVATSLAAHIDKPAPPCIIPDCTTIILHCEASGKEVEWLDPNKNVITTGRLHSKKLFIQLCTKMSYLICICSHTLHRTNADYKSSSNRFWKVHM